MSIIPEGTTIKGMGILNFSFIEFEKDQKFRDEFVYTRQVLFEKYDRKYTKISIAKLFESEASRLLHKEP